MTHLADQLAAWTAALRYEDLPPAVVHQAKRLIVDTLGCAIGGYNSEPVRSARDEGLCGRRTSGQCGNSQ